MPGGPPQPPATHVRRQTSPTCLPSAIRVRGHVCRHARHLRGRAAAVHGDIQRQGLRVLEDVEDQYPAYLASIIYYPLNTATTQPAPVSTFALDVDITIVSAGPLRSAPLAGPWLAIFRQLNIFIVIVIKCTAAIMISKTQTGTRGCIQSSYLRFNWVGRSNVSHLICISII